MALHGYWMSVHRKDLVEREMVRKRNVEAAHVEKLKSADRYHRELNLLSSQYKNLEGTQAGKTPKVNQESRLNEKAKAERIEKLFRRRQKLATLLERENKAHMVELEALDNVEQEKDPWNISKLKEQIEELRKRREEEEEELRRRSRYHQQTNVPYLKEYHDGLYENEVKKAMERKKKEMEEEALEKKVEEKHQLSLLQNAQQLSLLEVDATEKERKDAEFKWEELLQQQIDEMTENSNETEKLNIDVELLNSYLTLVEQVQSRGKEVNEIQMQRKNRINQFRNSKEKMRKMAAEIRHVLELDLTTLVYLSNMENKNTENGNSHLLMDEVKSAMDSIKTMLTLEIKREGEIQTMFDEEVIKLCGRRKKEWDDQQQSHEALMTKVLEGLIIQIKNKIASCLRAQSDLITYRRKLLDICTETNVKKEEENQKLISKKEYHQSKVQQVGEQIKKLNAEKLKKMPRSHPPPKMNSIIG